MEGWILYKHEENEIHAEEYEINRFIYVAKNRGIQLRVIKPEQFDIIVTRDDRKSIFLNGEVVPLPDFIIPRLGSGTSYFALSVIRHLERLGVHTINSSQSIEAVKDKLYTQQILAESNLPVPKTILSKYPVNIPFIEKQLGFPVILKTVTGSYGSGVFLSENRRNFEDIIQLISASKSNVNIIFQEFIKSSYGKDLRVFVVGGKAVGCMERRAVDGSFKANFTRGGSVSLYEMTPEIEWLATESSRILGLDVAGIDLLFDGEHFKICEANSAPGFEGMEQACDISIPDIIYDFISVRLGLYN